MSPRSRPARTSRSTAACTWASRARALQRGRTPVKVCVVGAGAIGGFLGTRLALTGEADVAALARGTTLVAAARSRLAPRAATDSSCRRRPRSAADDPRELGRQDLVILTVKAPALPRARARRCAPLIGPDTLVLPAMNGVPWWFSIGLAGARRAAARERRSGRAASPRHCRSRSVVGCVVHASASQREPGVALHRMGRGLIIGEPAGGESARVRDARGPLHPRGLRGHAARRNIRYDVWYKLWGNMTMNPVSALTGATADRVLADDLLREVCSAAMREAAAIGARIGCEVRESPEDRHAVTRKLGAFKTSMLQDVEAGRALELDALVGAVREIGAARRRRDADDRRAVRTHARVRARARTLSALKYFQKNSAHSRATCCQFRTSPLRDICTAYVMRVLLRADADWRRRWALRSSATTAREVNPSWGAGHSGFRNS